MLGKPTLLVLLSVTAGFAVSTASAERGSYRGPHPIPVQLPGSFCHIDASHTHTYRPPSNAAGYVIHNEDAGATQLEFSGDPTSLGYEGPLIAYSEPHPMLFWGGSGEVESKCNIEGSHYHLQEPFDLEKFEEYKGTYYFVSYKAAMATRRSLETSRRAEAKALKKEERRLKIEARRAALAERKSAVTTSNVRGGTVAPTKTRSTKTRPTKTRPTKTRPTKTAPAKTTQTKTTQTKTTQTKTTQTKSRSTKKKAKRGFRGWMDRRRGR